MNLVAEPVKGLRSIYGTRTCRSRRIRGAADLDLRLGTPARHTPAATTLTEAEYRPEH